MEIVVGLILIGLIPGVIARSKGRSFLQWWVYGTILFVAALPHVMLVSSLPREQSDGAPNDGLRPCPYCAEMIKRAAIVCRYCGRSVAEVED